MHHSHSQKCCSPPRSVFALVLALLALGAFIAHAAPPKTLTIATEGSGSVTLNPPGGSYARGTAVTMTAVPASGWSFDHWSGYTVNGYTNNPQVITMNNSCTVTAVFSQPTNIDTLRKREATIKVVDQQGQTVSNVAVQVDMTQSGFAFGTALSAGGLDIPQYRDWVASNYNWGVCGNESKWYYNEWTQGQVTYVDADKIYQFCAGHNIKMRGHCVFWGVQSNVQQWVQNLSYPAALQSAVDSRLNSVVPHFAGKFLHWDVNNEMLHGSFFEDRLGSGIDAYMFNRVKALDPTVKTFLNDYNVIEGGYSTAAYVTQINSLRAAGAQIDAVGVQCHMSSADTMNLVKQRLDTVAACGLPIWVTEYDCAISDPTARANYLESFYRTAFAHPAVEGIIMWGFWANDHWRGTDAALVNADWTVNAAGLRYKALRAEWSTNASLVSNSTGEASFNGFHGDYRVTLTPSGGSPECHYITLAKGDGTAQYNLVIGTGTPVDSAAPTPDPMTWAAPPTAMGHDVVSMAATTASDPSGVEYQFTNLTDATHSSQWQSSPLYIDSGLRPGTQYQYQVKARDLAPAQHQTAASAVASVMPPDDGNVLVNAEFEYGDTTGWMPYASCNITAISSDKHSGNFSARVTNRTQTYDGAAQRFLNSAVNGATYQCDAWIKLVNSASEPVGMSVRSTDQTGTAYTGVCWSTATNTGWVHLSGTYLLNYSGTVSDLTIYFEGPAVGAEYLIDDVSVVQVSGPVVKDMYVNSITMTKGSTGSSWYARATIQIKDETGASVSGATVSISWSGAVSGTSSGPTAADGTVTLQSASKRNGGTFTATVTGVNASGYAYSPTLNVVTSKSITAP